jgi:hypothetical protein
VTFVFIAKTSNSTRDRSSMISSMSMQRTHIKDCGIKRASGLCTPVTVDCGGKTA